MVNLLLRLSCVCEPAASSVLCLRVKLTKLVSECTPFFLREPSSPESGAHCWMQPKYQTERLLFCLCLCYFFHLIFKHISALLLLLHLQSSLNPREADEESLSLRSLLRRDRAARGTRLIHQIYLKIWIVRCSARAPETNGNCERQKTFQKVKLRI